MIVTYSLASQLSQRYETRNVMLHEHTSHQTSYHYQQYHPLQCINRALHEQYDQT